MTDESETQRRRLIYGRRYGHKLRGRQAELMESLLPQLQVHKAGADEPALGSLDPSKLFQSAPDGVKLEIGFGGGEHLAAKAQANPDTGFIGAEPYINGVAKLLSVVDDKGLRNIRLHDDDARDLLEWLAPSSIVGVYILYPDPWPKARHRKRRFVRPETIAQMARIMKPGAELLFASDIADYVRWTLLLMQDVAEFEWTAEKADDWRCPPVGWTTTRFETKALAAGRPPTYLTFRRR